MNKALIAKELRRIAVELTDMELTILNSSMNELVDKFLDLRQTKSRTQAEKLEKKLDEILTQLQAIEDEIQDIKLKAEDQSQKVSQETAPEGLRVVGSRKIADRVMKEEDFNNMEREIEDTMKKLKLFE